MPQKKDKGKQNNKLSLREERLGVIIKPERCSTQNEENATLGVKRMESTMFTGTSVKKSYRVNSNFQQLVAWISFSLVF